MHSIVSRANRILLIILAGDLFFIVMHILFILSDMVSDSSFYLAQDRGYAELYEYIQLLIIVGLFAFYSIRTKMWLYTHWMAFFTYYFLDDSLQIHETVGYWLVSILGIPSFLSLRAQDVGEIGMYGVIGLFFLSTFTTSYRVSDDSSRRFSHVLILFIAALVFFGGIFDMLSSTVFESLPALRELFVIVEDGGEMAVVSFILWILLRRYPLIGKLT